MTTPTVVPALPEGLRQHGAVRSYLSTDTRAGPRAVYEAVGMVVTSTWVNWAVDL